MLLRFLITSIIVITSASSRAETRNAAASYLALCHPRWPCAASLEAFKGLDTLRFGWLARTFGDACPCLHQIKQDPRPKIVRVHLVNWVCVRNRRCGPYEVLAGESVSSAEAKVRARDPKILAKFREVAQITVRQLAALPGLRKCYVSPCLECDLSDAARRVLIDEAKAIFPGCTMVDSVYKPSCLKDPGVVCEKHGEKSQGLKPPYLVDLDGTDMQKVDLVEYLLRNKDAEMTHLWTLKSNCNDDHIPTFVDPRARSCQFNPKVFQIFRRYLQPDASVIPPLSPVDPRDLAGCKKVAKAEDGPGGFLSKESDSYPGGVVLLPRGLRPRTLRLVKGGVVVAEYKYGAQFSDGRAIYRTDKSIWNFPTNAVFRSELGCWGPVKWPLHRVD